MSGPEGTNGVVMITKELFDHWIRMQEEHGEVRLNVVWGEPIQWSGEILNPSVYMEREEV